MNQTMLSVLIVEDDVDVMSYIVNGLRDFDDRLEIDQQTTLADALKACTDKIYNGIITDLILPDAKGTLAIRSLRKMTTLPGSPPTSIIALTGSDVTATEAIEAGADDYIEKGKLKQTWIGVLDEKFRHAYVRNQLSVMLQPTDTGITSMRNYIKPELDEAKRITNQIREGIAKVKEGTLAAAGT